MCADPIGISVILANQCFNNWTNFAENNVSLKLVRWSDRSLLFKEALPKQVDNFNCGVMVAYYLKNFINENFLFYFDTSVRAMEELILSMANSIIESVQ